MDHLSGGVQANPTIDAIPDTPENRAIMNQVSVLMSQLQKGESSGSAQTFELEQVNGGEQSLIGLDDCDWSQERLLDYFGVHDTAHSKQMYSITPQVTPHGCNMGTQQDTAVCQGSTVRQINNQEVQYWLNFLLGNEPLSRNVQEQDPSLSSENDTSSSNADVNNKVMDTSSSMQKDQNVADGPRPQEKEIGTDPIPNSHKNKNVPMPIEERQAIFLSVLDRLEKKDYQDFHDLLLKFYELDGKEDHIGANGIVEAILLLPKTSKVDSSPHPPQQLAAQAKEVLVAPQDESGAQSVPQKENSVQRQRETEEVIFKRHQSREENSRKRETYRMDDTTPAKRDRITAHVDNIGQNSCDFENHPIPRFSMGLIANQSDEWIPLFVSDHRRNQFPCPRDIFVFMNPQDPYQRTYMIPEFHAPVYVNHREPDWRMHFDPNNPAHRTQEYENQLINREYQVMTKRGPPAQQMQNAHPHCSGHIHQPQIQIANDQNQILQNMRHNPIQNVQDLRHQQNPNNRGSQDLQNSRNPQNHIHILTFIIENPNNYPHQMQIRAMTPETAMHHPTYVYQTMPNASNPGSLCLNRSQPVQPMLSPVYQNPRNLHYSQHNMHSSDIVHNTTQQALYLANSHTMPNPISASPLFVVIPNSDS